MNTSSRIKYYFFFILTAAFIGLVVGIRTGNQIAYDQTHGANIAWMAGDTLPAELAGSLFDPAEQGYFTIITPAGQYLAHNKGGQWVPRPESGPINYAEFPDIICSGADSSSGRIIRQPPGNPVSRVDCRIRYSPETARYIRYVILDDNTIWSWSREEHPGLVISDAGTYLENWFKYGLLWGGWALAGALIFVLFIDLILRLVVIFRKPRPPRSSADLQ